MKKNLTIKEINEKLNKADTFFANDELDECKELLDGLYTDLVNSNAPENKTIRNFKSRIFYTLGCIYHMKNEYEKAIKEFEQIDNSNNVIRYRAIIESYISSVSYNIIHSMDIEEIEIIANEAKNLPSENNIEYVFLIINLIKCYEVIDTNYNYYDYYIDIDEKIRELKNIPGLESFIYYECLAENSYDKYEVITNYKKTVDLIVKGMFKRDEYDSLQIARKIYGLYRYDKVIELIDKLLKNIDNTPENIDDIYKYEMLKAEIYSRYEEYKEAKDTLITLRAKKEDATLIFSLWGLYLKLGEDENRKQMLDIFRDKYGGEYPEVLKIIDEIEAENTKDSGDK